MEALLDGRVAHQDEVPGLHEADRGRVMGGEEDAGQHLVVDLGDGEPAPLLAPADRDPVAPRRVVVAVGQGREILARQCLHARIEPVGGHLDAVLVFFYSDVRLWQRLHNLVQLLCRQGHGTRF